MGMYRLWRLLNVGVIFILTFSILAVSCSTTTYVRPGEVTNVDYTFSDTDLKLMAEKMAMDIAELTAIKFSKSPPKIACLYIENKTYQHIDTDAILDKIMTALLKTGTVRFMDRKVLREMAREKALVERQSINVEDAVKLGQLVGADYFLLGTLSSIEKRKGTKTIAYYRLSLRLVNVHTSEIIWADEKELKKISKKGILDW